ncbi:DUF3048 domain-containing protein [Halanaerobium salsuginis]|uniref:DUF3048 domain-containing protein n=1 Tax=Halanaerobium salsuginis TaxID=29563 RepID=A0A1I4GAF1_9FIRM|nr:DUF3048 domain-containing protein [Halanaerobium salsuginis]SFL26101.1 Protein of unknown function [Halanaerobium salsuginis]
MKFKCKIMAVIILLLLVLLTGCTKKDDSPAAIPVEKSIDKNNTSDSQQVDKQLDQSEEVPDEISEDSELEQDSYSYKAKSPFTGLPLQKNYYQRALAVSIENSPAARPQTGLAQADIVYEFMLEGGITRFLAIYWPDIPAKIGPIRSARPALIETATDYDALFLHAGASPDGFAMLSQGNVLHLDQIYQSNYFWRSSKRKAPHNLYSGKPVLQDYLASLQAKEYPEQFNFSTVSLLEDFTKAENITVDYWGSYSVLYKYDALHNIYFRYLNDVSNPHLNEAGDQLTAKNIIIQYVNMKTKDSAGRQDIDLNSGGKIELFRDGTVIEGNWIRKNGRINYLNKSGKEIELNPGQTWIEVINTGAEIIY